MTILYKEQLKGDNNPHWKGGMAKKICPICEKVFEVTPSVIKSSHYCSRACSAIGRTKPKQAGACKVCRKPFEDLLSRKRLFCSNKCYKKSMKAEGNPRWKDGRQPLSQRIRNCNKSRRLIASTLRQDKYTCQECKQVGGDLEVDHIKPFSEILDEFLQYYQVLSTPEFAYELYLIALKYKPFWDKNNLRTLCRKCNWDKQVLRQGKSQPARMA